MLAALKLRLLEARRRGGLLLLGAGALLVGWIALFPGETVDGRYGLATDIATTFGYIAALFFGALPLAADRECKRSYLPCASPVRPWSWALGNALGAATLGGVGAFVLFFAAGLGASMRGGIETHATTRTGQTGTIWLPGKEVDVAVRYINIPVPPEATHLRLLPRVYIGVEKTVGATDSATVEVDGTEHEFFPNQPLVVPIRSSRVSIRNLSEDHAVGLDKGELRALVGRRPFLLNAVGAGVGPSLGAAALAALGAAASANLTAPIAALLVALVLVLGSLKGFIVETFRHEGAAQRAMDDHGHQHTEHVQVGAGARAVARTVVEGLLYALPDLNGLDRTDRVAIGEWTGLKRAGNGVLLLAIALAIAVTAGGLGVHARRMP